MTQVRTNFLNALVATPFSDSLKRFPFGVCFLRPHIFTAASMAAKCLECGNQRYSDPSETSAQTQITGIECGSVREVHLG